MRPTRFKFFYQLKIGEIAISPFIYGSVLIFHFIYQIEQCSLLSIENVQLVPTVNLSVKS